MCLSAEERKNIEDLGRFGLGVVGDNSVISAGLLKDSCNWVVGENKVINLGRR